MQGGVAETTELLEAVGPHRVHWEHLVGKIVMAASKHLTPVTLELGKNPTSSTARRS